MYRNVAKHSKIPLRSALIFPFILQIFLAVGLTGYLSLQSGQKAVNDIASQLRHEIATRIEQNLQTYLAAPHLVNQMNADAVSLGQLNIENMAAWERHIWLQKKQFNSLNGIVIVNEKGQGIGIGNNDEGKLIIQATSPTEANQVSMYLAGSQGERLKLIEVAKNYDVRTTNFHQQAIKAGKPIWTEIRYGYVIKTPVIWASQPIFDKAGQVLGVSSAVLRLSLIGDFLQTLKVGKTGQIFIIERDGMLVATSTAERPYRDRQRFPATDSKNILTQTIAKYLTNQFKNLNDIKSFQSLEFLLKGQKQLVEIFPFQDSRGIDWLIVIAVPENDFMEQINANRNTTILLCLLALFLATALGIKTSQWIIRPILRLGEATSAIATGAFEQKIITSSIKEISALSVSFNFMSQQLKQSYKQLEDYSRSLEQKVAERTQKLEQEIRDRQQIQDILQESEERYQLTLESVNDGIWDWRVQPNTMYFSPQWKAMLGYQDSEIPNGPSSWNTLVHPNDLPLVTNSVAAYMKSGSNESYSWEFRMQHKNGSYRWILSRGRVVERDTSGQALRLVGSHTDISDRKLIEQERERFLAVSSSLQVITGINGYFHWVSPSFEKILSRTPAEMISRPWTDFVHPDDIQASTNEAANLFEGSETFTFENRYQHQDGSYRWLLWRAKPYPEEQVLYGAAIDITDRKQIEQQLRTSLKEKEVLLREVYHRVKNNMQLVSSLLSLQANTIADPAVLRLLNESQQRVKTMALIHERLYRSDNLARINTATYIQDLVNNLILFYKTTGSSIQVNFDVAELELDLDVAVPCSLIINELVSNALKYAFPDQQGEIKLQFWLDNTGNYCLMVKDDGIGIPVDIEPHNTETLGMQLVYGLTQQLGGAIELDRREGSQFRIIFRKRY